MHKCSCWDNLKSIPLSKFPQNNKDRCILKYDHSWEDIFKFGTSVATAPEFYEEFQVGTDLCIAHSKYQVKPHLSLWFSASFVAAMASRSHFFRLFQQIKFCVSQVKLRQEISCKHVNLLRSIQQRITSQKHGCGVLWQIANIVLNKGKSTIPPLCNYTELLSSAYDKAKLFAGNFFKNSILHDSGIFLPDFASIANLEWYNILVTSKLVKKIIAVLVLSKTSGTDCIPVVVLKNCEPERSYMLTEFFSICLKESCLQNFWKALSLFPVCFMDKTYHPVSLLS